jgi:hypothetical protein
MSFEQFKSRWGHNDSLGSLPFEADPAFGLLRHGYQIADSVKQDDDTVVVAGYLALKFIQRRGKMVILGKNLSQPYEGPND